jgi:hypothetical protein
VGLVVIIVRNRCAVGGEQNGDMCVLNYALRVVNKEI